MLRLWGPRQWGFECVCVGRGVVVCFFVFVVGCLFFVCFVVVVVCVWGGGGRGVPYLFTEKQWFRT